jgi:hypothetical protein
MMADARTELPPSLLGLPALSSFALQPLLPTASVFKNLFLLFCGQLESFVNRVLCDEPCCSTPSLPTVSSAGQPYLAISREASPAFLTWTAFEESTASEFPPIPEVPGGRADPQPA